MMVAPQGNDVVLPRARRGTRLRRWAAGATAVALSLPLLAAGARPAAAAGPTPGVITSTGPLTKIAVSNDLSCAVNRAGDSHGEFYNDTACGTFLAVGTTTFGPANVPAGPQDPGTSGYKKFTPVSQTAVTGAGTAASPYQVVTRVTAGTTGIQVTQTDSYVVGQESYRTDVALTNVGASSANVVVYRASDCYLQNSDQGFGAADTSTGSVSCVGSSLQGTNHVPNS
ncbi:MAG: hypothetical protein JO087_16105, partial [Actinobacteria bacterium]|nr:hypothetical protein [Actinomycetota bacterium]